MVLITGFSGRFPASESFADFWEKLCSGVDLVEECPTRYPPGFSGLPDRQAQCRNVDKFDSMFFGISSAQADSMDPQIRLLLEVVFEAIQDAGYTMEDLARSNTGVYVGGCFSDMHKALLRDIRTVNGYENTGCSHSMFANRVSFCFDFTGPSLTIDTACSSSLVALDVAARDIRSGKVDRAVVAGVSIAMDPAVTKSFSSYGMLSPDGKCHSFDDRANGYVRADGVGAILLESDVLGEGRGIASLLGTGSNSDGSKAKGITFPASGQQLALCKSVCEEYSLDPSKVVYVEAHGTGTTAGDGQELNTLNSAYGCDSGVLIGSVKSNMGHSEGASGMMSLLKVLGVITEGIIPMNLHYQGTKVHEPIMSGRLRVVDNTQPLPSYESGTSLDSPPLIAINNFGFGGTNAHLVCCSGDRKLVEDNARTRFIFARTENGLQSYFKNDNLNKAAWDVHMRSSTSNNKFPYRGVVKDDNTKGLSITTARVPPVCPPVAFCYTGQGCQWESMAQDLWLGDNKHSEIFRATIVEATVDLPVDVDTLFSKGDMWLSKQWSGFGITLVQVGLTAILTSSGIVPDFIFGHSVGEVACGYADGCTSAKEAARIAFVRCQLSDRITASGLMIAVGLDYDSAVSLLASYENTVVACHNSPDGVTLSGSEKEVLEIESHLKAKGIFAKVVPTDGIAYHSKFFKDNSRTVETILEGVITDDPIPRTSRWISTSCEECRLGIEHGCYRFANAAYHTRNITGQVNFEPVVRSLPKGVVIVEVGPHALLKSIIKRCRTAENEESPVLLSTMRRGHSAVDHISSLIDSLWLEGVCFNFPRTQNMVPIRNRVNMEWDHDVLWRTPQFSDFSASSGSSSELKIKFDLAGKDAFLMDHVIDGHPLLPATAHIYCAWAAFETEEIHFVDIKILAAVMLDGESLSLKVVTNETGWKIYSDDKLVSQGTIAKEYQIPSVSEGNFSDSFDDKEWVDKSTVYSRFARYGYEYGEAFRVIQRRSTDGRNVILDSACHWIAYLDNILQAFLNNPSGLFLPTSIATVSIRCKDVKDASCFLVQNCDLNSFGNSDVTIRGLKTSVMKKTHKAPTIRGVEFIPYGEHIIVHEEDFKCQLITYLSSAAASTGDSLVDENVKACLVELLEEAGKAVDVVPTIPRFEEDLRMKNQVLSCNWCVDGLDIISQVIRENFTRSYSVLRVGDHSIPSDDLFRLIDPLISHDVDNQSYKSISESWEVNFPVDTIILANALYASTNVSDTLLNVVNTLPDGGFLVVREYIGILPNLLWGNQVTPTDDTRNNGRWMTKSTILERVTSVGLDVVVWYVDKSSTQLVILAVKPRSGEVTNVSSRHEMSAAPYNLVTEDYGHLGFIRSLRKEPGYNDINLSLTLPSSSPVDSDAISATYSLPFHISSDGVTGGIHEVPLRSIDKKNGKATTRGFHLRVTRPGDLESLTWIENDVESNCEVRFCGINFKDVMLSYGKLASADSGGHVKIGLEFSGEIEGKPVMGIAAGCMATHIQTPKHLLWEVPNSLSLEDACTLPVVYSTVYYALVIKANIREGQTVLIHSIGGGVGQAAFHVCKHRGVKVIATCSSAKKDWVHSHLGISRDLILDSHGLDFRDAVLSLTSGAGVDVVLNSLSGEKLQASLDCVGQYGHFCEIGKYDIQQNMPIGMGIFERNISIHGFDLSDMFNKPRLWQPVRDLLTAGLKSGEVKPLCLTVFDDAEQALRHMSSGKHIGKVLVRLPKASDVNIAAGGTTVGISRHLRSFRTNGTHLVVGGLGGFGFELVAFLQARGAEHIIISSRGNPKPFQQRILGDTVTVTHVNLKDTKSCDEFIQGEGNNLVGIWHLGMVLNDCLYDNMSTSAWDETVSTKKDICINLDLSSRSYCKNLKHFVMWSSVSALYGNPGQTNYAYANSAMEGVCMARHQAGLPGIAIQWGFIGSVGVLAQNQTTNSSLTFSPQHIDSCLESLDSILPSEHAVVSCYIRQFDTAGEDGDGGVKTLSVSQRVARVLGLDPVKINSTDMLSSLGMDSLQSVEIANVLKMAGLVKALDELRGMTWTEILNFD